MSQDKPLAHAITDLDGFFVGADAQFCSLLKRAQDDIIGRTILDVTGEAFRGMNTDKLAELRESGQPFIIRKTYICGDGTVQGVENSVSLILRGSDRPMFAASVKAIAFDAGTKFVAAINLARALLDEQRWRLGAGDFFEDRDWRLQLAGFIAEAEGRSILVDDLCDAAGGDPRRNRLRVWELVTHGVLVVEGKPASLGDANVRVAADRAMAIQRHLEGRAGS